MARLGDIVTVVSGTTPKSGVSEYWDGDINWITPAELEENSDIIYESKRKITEKAVRDSSLKSFPAGTVILSSRAPIGKVAIAGTEMYCNQGFKNLICSSEIYNRYLYHFLKSKTEFLNSLGRGATFKEISKSIVENIELPLPEMAKQILASEQLDKINELISLRHRQLERLDTLAKSQFIEMFGDPIENPMKWKTARLTDLGACKNGMNFHAGDAGFDLNCLGVGDFKDLAIIDDTSCLSMVSLNEAPPEEYLLQDGDIVFVRSNGNKALVGRCLAVFPQGTKTTFSGFCIRYRLKSKNLLTMYLLHLLKTTSVRQKLVGRGANIQNLNQKILGELMIPVPPIELQDEFTAFIKQADKSKFAIQQSIDKLETLKKSLMQQYFG